MSMVELFVPMTLFIALAVIAGLITRLIATASLNKTIREALRSHPESVPILADKLYRPSPWGDALLGWIFLAFAAALALLGLTEEEPASRTEMLRAAIVPVIVGVAVLVYAWLAERRGAGG